MIRTEDDLRLAFDQIVGPDSPPPGFDALRRRAKRRRLQQAGAALTTVVILAAGSIGAVALSRDDGTTIDPSAVTRTPTHIAGVAAQQWLVSQRAVAGTTYRAASYRNGDRDCLQVTDGIGWCAASHWPKGEVADYTVASTGSPRVVAVIGRVPANAQTVSVTYDGGQSTVPAVATPTSDHERFFAAFIKLPGYDFPGQPLIGVTDATGQPVAPIVAGDGPITSSEHTHYAGLPSNQIGLSYDSDGHTDVIYTQGDQVCFEAWQSDAKIAGPSCQTGAPTGSRILGVLHRPGKIIEVIGVQPTWASTTIASAQGYQALSSLHVPGINNMNFFILQGNGGHRPYVIATCHAGANCTTVLPFDPKDPTGR